MPKQSIEQILKKVLAEIKPTEKEKKVLKSTIQDFVTILKRAIKGLKADVFVGGSWAKGTWLKKKIDIDIFIRFNYKEFADRSGALSDILEAALSQHIKLERMRGSRDYFRSKHSNVIFEIIPILKIRDSSEAENITDVSPLHVRWVKQNTTPKLRDQIRLAKQFCNVQRIYGAESYIQGFSGYLLEVLTITYGSFLELLKGAAKWKRGTFIDPAHHYKEKQQALEQLPAAKTYSPLILIDPVQRERNIAAALSKRSFDIFKKAAASFLKSPSIDFFKVKKITPKSIFERAKRIKAQAIILEALPKSGKQDIVGCKLLRAYRFIAKQLKLNDFRVIESDWFWDKESNKAFFWYILPKEALELFKKVVGPPKKVRKHAKRFMLKHPNAFEEKGRLYAMIRRSFTEPKQFIENLLSKSYFNDKVKKISFLS